VQIRDQLVALLDESSSACRQREQNAFDEIASGSCGLVLFGAGGLGRKILAALRADNIEPLAFVDNKLAGQVVDGIDVLTPREGARRWGRSAAFVITIWAAWADSMAGQTAALRNLGCETVVSFIPLLWKYSHLLPHVQIDLPSRVLTERDQVIAAFDLWSDESSRQEFLAQVCWRLSGDFTRLREPLPDPYWQRDLIHLGQNSVFVDAGAFNGDTLGQFIDYTAGRFRAAYVFEPDALNLRSLELRLAAMEPDIRTRIKVFECAISDRSQDVSFHGGAGEGSAPGSGTEVVHCVTLDDTVREAPDLIKFDIEGFELLGLSGSRHIIHETAPSLAVCAYHVQNHLWRIPLLINSFRSDYRFYLRPHGQIWETVCYSIPNSVEAGQASHALANPIRP
jgi:FkbM family methyltransferase